jgi:hypothetical protein
MRRPVSGATLPTPAASFTPRMFDTLLGQLGTRAEELVLFREEDNE